MAGWMNREAGLKDPDKEEKSPFTTQVLFGKVEDQHRKKSRSEQTTICARTARMFQDYQREFELQKSRAIAYTPRPQTFLK